MRQTNQKRKRLIRAASVFIAVLVCGFAYAFLCNLLDFGIPCFFRLITGFKCPGCGVSRMCISLLKLDLVSAWKYNAAVLCMLPLGAVVFVDVIVRYISCGVKIPHKWCSVLIWLMIAALLIFGVFRNIYNL